MSVVLDILRSKVGQLTVEELLALQEEITSELRVKTASKKANVPSRVPSPTLPGAYRPTKEGIEASLEAVFTPDELARMGKADFSKLPLGSKSVTEIISEDREDRV